MVAIQLRAAVRRARPGVSGTLGRVAPRAAAAVASMTTTSPLLESLSPSEPVAPPHRFYATTSPLHYTADDPEKVRSLQKQGIYDSAGLLEFNTLHELQKNASLAYTDNDIFGTYVPKMDDGGEGKAGDFEYMTYGEYGERVDRCRAVLKDLGVEQYSKVGIISNNRWEWATIAAASYSLNATLVPMYEAQMPSDWTYILNDSGCSALFCATEDIYTTVTKEVLPSAPCVKATLCLDAPSGAEHAFATAMERADPASCKVIAPTPDDLGNLVYTSGTTGKPKGVELIHSNTSSNVKAATQPPWVTNPRDFVRESDRSLAFLPWAHSYGQTCELWSGMSAGGSMGICRGVPFIVDDLQLVQPTVLFAVPTLYKRIYDGVHNLMENASPLRKTLMGKALALGRRNVESSHGGPPLSFLESVQFKALDGIVLKKIRARFGGNLRHGFVAGAACPGEIIDFMDDIGIPICEGYGLTETSPIITLNTPEQRKVGSVGQPIAGVTVLIVGEEGLPVKPGEEGEVCCHGLNVMRGYYKNPKATDEVISLAPDGKSRLFHTGDLGRMGSDNFLHITGRLKEQYKLENGKYVCPTPIEEAIGMSRFISQLVLCGANRPHNVALIVPDWVAIRAELKLGEDTPEEQLANAENVRSLISNEISTHCKKLKKFEIPNDFAFVAPFTAANNMLTPKMSIRRHMVIRTYEDTIGHMYGDDVGDKEPVITESTDGFHHEDNSKVA